MKYISTQGIILQKTIFQDFRYIIQLYSPIYGNISASVETNNLIHPAYIQVPNICQFELVWTKHKKYHIKEIRPIYVYKQIPVDFRKNIISQFIIEIVIKTTRDGFLDEKIFQLLSQSFIELDSSFKKDHFFHLYFLKKYIQLSGWMPLNNYDNHHVYFDLAEGRFCTHPSPSCLSKEDSQYCFELFFREQIEDIHYPVWRVTHCVLDYLKYHGNVYSVESLNLLKEALMEFNV